VEATKALAQQRHLTGRLTVIEERRFGERFPIVLSLDFRIQVDRATLFEGHGSTVNFSKTGLLFTPGLPCPRGASAKLAVAWPAASEHSVMLEIIGKVARNDEHGTVVRISRHKFRDDSCRAAN